MPLLHFLTLFLCNIRYFCAKLVEIKYNLMAKLVRSKDRVIAGVCAGVAEHFGWNARNVRLMWFIATIIFVGSPIIFYLILMFLMPASGSGKNSYEERMRNRLAHRQ